MYLYTENFTNPKFEFQDLETQKNKKLYHHDKAHTVWDQTEFDNNFLRNSYAYTHHKLQKIII